MRLDLFLKASRIVPRRSLANELCDAGLVKVNSAAAKPAREIKAGDEIEIKRRSRITKLRGRAVPAGKQVSKQQAPELYEILSEEILPDDLFD